ncbi:MAG: prepilin peptidase [Promethearchaeota archaeon]
MNFIYFLINQCFIYIIFFIFLYLDLKSRKISLKLFKITYTIGLIFNLIESLLFVNNIFLILYIRFFFFFSILIISVLLFNLKIIGGSDGKLFILIFLILPIHHLNLLYIMLFFLSFSIFFIIIFIINLVVNSFFIKNNAFYILFNINSKMSNLQKLFLKSFFKFCNFTDLNTNKIVKNPVKSLILVYNDKKLKFQMLCQYRPPLIIIIILSYTILLYLIICC